VCVGGGGGTVNVSKSGNEVSCLAGCHDHGVNLISTFIFCFLQTLSVKVITDECKNNEDLNQHNFFM
jgi:hypothetical protein